LLSTPPHGDAVTFSYGAVAYSDTDFHRANMAPSRAHDSRFRGNDTDKAPSSVMPAQAGIQVLCLAW